MRPALEADPFTVLGLPARPGLTDDEVRSAWRRIAAQTHPDRADGGDPARFAGAAAAYTVLRTRFGRAEALADLAAPAAARRWLVPFRGQGRVRRGRPARLALRIAGAAAISLAVALVAGARPATPALIIGAATWLALTARHDLAPLPPRTQREVDAEVLAQRRLQARSGRP